MKQITCELCGSNELVKNGEYFICQHCGTKYTVEEAKKLMVEGTVKIDNSDMIKNYLVIANNAYSSGNNSEAELYCNKIIEIDPSNYEVWLLKGKVAGWQSTLANLRIEEAITCFSNAIDNAPEEDIENVKRIASNEVEEMSVALVKLQCDNYANYPSIENGKNIFNVYVKILEFATSLIIKCNDNYNYNDDIIDKRISKLISDSALSAWNNEIYADYQRAKPPTRYDWDKFVKRGTVVISLYEFALKKCGNDINVKKVLYSNMITIQTAICDSASYSYDAYMGKYTMDYQLNSSYKEEQNKKIMEWHREWNRIDPTHIVPSEYSVSQQTNSKANQEKSDNTAAIIFGFIFIALLIIVAFTAG